MSGCVHRIAFTAGDFACPHESQLFKLLAMSSVLNSRQIQGVNPISLLLLIATLSAIPPSAIDSWVTPNHEKRPMDTNNSSLLNKKPFLFRGLSTLARQVILFASVLSKNASR